MPTTSEKTHHQVPVDPTITAAATPGAVGDVAIDEGWRPLLEEICTLKEALDHATRWGVDRENVEWMDSAFRAHGLRIEHFANSTASDGPHFPDEFMRILLGSWFGRKWKDEDTVAIGPVTMPSWATVGWVRKERYTTTPTLTSAELITLANEVNLQESNAPSVTVGYYGAPFFLADEGKNRTQLQRLANVPRLTTLYMRSAQPFSEFTIRPAPFMPWGIALEHPNRPTEILPFGDLSKRLLLALGARWDDRPCWKAIFALRETCRLRRLDVPTWSDLFKRPKNDHALRMLLIGGPSLMLSSAR